MSIITKPFKYTFRNVALILIGINILVYMGLQIFPQGKVYLSLNPALFVYNKFYWQVFTYQFVHNGFMHLFSNMLGLFFFGMAVERKIGSREFLSAYLVSGTLCGIISLLIYISTGMWRVFLLGASGAVFAVLLLYAVLFPRSVIFLWGIIPIPAPLLVIGYAVLETVYMISGSQAGIAHGTHLTGFAVAWIYSVVRLGINPLHIWFPKR